MYFHKINIPDNFSFTAAGREVIIKDYGDNVFNLSVKAGLWKTNFSQAELSPGQFSKLKSKGKVAWSPVRGLTVSLGRQMLLASEKGRALGVCGNKWMFCFSSPEKYRYYGLGEKNNGFEKSGVKTKFWNTDVWADFAVKVIRTGVTDPMYVSVPYVLMQRGGGWLGVLIDNPAAPFMALGPELHIAKQQEAETKREFYLGALDGTPSIYFILGLTPGEVTCRLQKLAGVTPRPPLWALGHHQCRWGYESYRDLDRIEKGFRKNRIPNDGVWLDIDYMDSFKVFTWDKKNFKNPGKEIKEIRARGAHVVPILDPGVKNEKGYAIREEGIKGGHFCLTSEGAPYTGYVWPGKTYFPDFSLPSARKWWAEKVAGFAQTGVSGAWLDMNDPAVGHAELEEMRFNKGKFPHWTYHNQYGLGMARASYQGFLKADKDKRPFLLARSGFTSSSRYTAVWTGDNCSNFYHLRTTVALSLNLALSGIPFNGPDVPGFHGDAPPELAEKWYKACFLFPFLRNHTVSGSKPQEPWRFPVKIKKSVSFYIRLRYKLLPYLYNLFISQEKEGTPILRPLFFDFKAKRGLDLFKTDDQFMTGPSVMQAPILAEGLKRRKVVLPEGSWYSSLTGKFIKGGVTINAATGTMSTPLYIKSGSIIPMQAGTRTDNKNDLKNIELHFFFAEGHKKEELYDYTIDDGLSFAYRKGGEEIYRVRAGIKNKTFYVSVKQVKGKEGSLSARCVFHTGLKKAVINGREQLIAGSRNPFQAG